MLVISPAMSRDDVDSPAQARERKDEERSGLRSNAFQAVLVAQRFPLFLLSEVPVGGGGVIAEP
ncbi:hypothetical protein GOB87_13720 [Acetobacter estunensis]|uniref:Uncharacterized protein n=1 Tax=Acetobacter estunensis TaxID=104097 RepID=A0A967BAJ5_9PROT|nr:hypothetical protein [Acetobacter estunensis]